MDAKSKIERLIEAATRHRDDAQRDVNDFCVRLGWNPVAALAEPPCLAAARLVEYGALLQAVRHVALARVTDEDVQHILKVYPVVQARALEAAPHAMLGYVNVAQGEARTLLGACL